MFLSIEEFSKRIRSNANRSTKEQRFGPDKVYISDLYDMDDMGLTLPEFKQMLGDANRKGLLRLSRADLVELMPAAKVKASDTKVENALFNFVRADNQIW